MSNTLEILVDTLEDEISEEIKRLNSLTKWTSEKWNLLESLISRLESLQYQQFILKEHRYKAGVIGNSFIYKVSEKRRGLFAPFRGKSVRVICVGSGRFDRTVMVKPID
jgi:hypothetical protein